MGSGDKHMICRLPYSEHAELLAHTFDAGALLNGENVEANGLREWPALADGHDVALLHVEGRGDVRGDVAVALLETPVLFHELEVARRTMMVLFILVLSTRPFRIRPRMVTL